MADNSEKLAALEAEQNELRLMIREGVTFDVALKYKRRKPGFWGWFKKRETVTENRVFKIQEPTLATLDRLSAIWVQLEIDETKLTDEDYLRTAKNIAASGTRKLAEIVAIAVLGEDYYIATDKGGYFTRKEDKAALRRLTDTFAHALKPSELFQLAVLITNVSNLGDFINSIRLMSATRTSDPTHLIEPQG
jgi:hypothetical protein